MRARRGKTHDRMNSTLPARVIDRARQQDAAAAASEWDAELYSDLSTFLDAELIARTGYLIHPS